MKKMIKMSLAAAMIMGISSVTAQATEIMSNVKAKGEIRARYENVDADNGKNDANALTNRLMIGVGADLFGTDFLSAYVEMTDVHALNDNYNSTNNGGGSGNVQVVADPEQTRVTQAYIDIKSNGFLLRSGRQMINLDNQRFVGAVGWRQMPQTFDAFLLSYTGVKNLNLAAVYVSQVNRIFADARNSFETETVLLNGSYKVSDALKVTLYDYMISSVSDTYGISLTGKTKLGDAKINYRAEYAVQADASLETDNNGKPDADADYYNLNVGVNMNGILGSIGYEVLSGANASGSETAFSTPLATLHGKNGWADKFLGTPAGGIEDLSFMLGYKSKDLGLFKVVYHDFQADTGSVGDYGTEIDAVYKNKVPGVKGLVAMLKYADYDADNYSVDTTKIWFMLDYKFATN